MGIVLLVLATFAWAGWANWEYRKQAAEKRLANVSQGELVEAGRPPGRALIRSSARRRRVLAQDLSGKKVSLADYKGKALLINFWATWCGPCKVETPWMVDLRNQYAAKGFEVFGVSTDDIDRDDSEDCWHGEEGNRGFRARMHMPYPVLIEGDSLSKPYGGLDAMPTSFFVDRDGKDHRRDHGNLVEG